MTPGLALLFRSLMLSANSPVNAQERRPKSPAPAPSLQHGDGLSCKWGRAGVLWGVKGWAGAEGDPRDRTPRRTRRGTLSHGESCCLPLLWYLLKKSAWWNWRPSAVSLGLGQEG